MFGLKWLWKSNKGSSIDTSNFVSKEFFSTTLQEYVNRDLFNTTLSEYITTTSLNNTLNNYLTTNTEQTITGLKTFRAAPVALKFKQADGRSDKQYITFNANNNTTTFSLGSSAGETSFEANQGNIVFQTQQANKTIKFDTANVNLETVSNVYFNRAVPQFGQEIKAGWGGGVVKFIPEDNSTKTLQFFNENPTDQRRFNLKINEPAEATNPATKNYVDNLNNSNVEQINDINSWRDTTSRELTTINNVLQNTTQNMVNTNTQQTISAEKTFSSLVAITKTNGALAFKPGTNQPAYFEFYNGNTRIGYFGKGSSQHNNMTLGAENGKIELQASQGVVVPEPTQANNPATKQYVDNLFSSNTNMGLNLKYQDLDLSSLQKDIDTDLNTYTRVQFTISTLQNVKLLSMSLNYTDQNVLEIIKKWVFNYAEGNNSKIYCSLFNAYIPLNPQPVLTKTFLRIFYIDLTGARVENPYFIEEGDN